MERRHFSLKLNRTLWVTLVIVGIVLAISSIALAQRGLPPFRSMSTSTVSAFTGYRLPWANGESWAVTCKGQCQNYEGDHTNQIDFDVIGFSPPGNVYAAKPGKVIYIKQVSGPADPHTIGYQNEVIIEHGPGEYSWYVHLAQNSVPVSIGQLVGYGTMIGIEGDTGKSSSDHLHFMVSTSIPNIQYPPTYEYRQYAPWPPSGSIVAVNFFESSWDSLTGNEISQNGADGSCNGYESPGVSLFENKDCTGRALIFYTPGTYVMSDYSFNDIISSISINRTWQLKVYRDNNGRTGPSRVMFGSNVYDRTKWNLESDWYDSPYDNVPMNDSISLIECDTCQNAAASSTLGALSTNATCPLGTPVPTPLPQPTVNPTSTPLPPPTPTSVPSASWNARFYGSMDECSEANCNPTTTYLNTNITGQSLNLSFADGRAFGQGPSQWGAIMQQTINFGPGNWVFHVDHNDGVKLFINGMNIVDVWGSSENNTACPARSLSGPVAVTIIWKNTGGDAHLRVWWDTNASTCNPIPAAPGNLRQTNSTQNSVSIAWDDNSGNETGFKVLRWNGTSFVPFAWVGVNVTGFTDNNVVCGMGYFYEIAAYNSNGESPLTGFIQASTQACPQIPTAPSNLQVVNSASNGFTLQWADNSTNEDGFKILWWNGSTYEVAANVGSNTTSAWIGKPCGWSGQFVVVSFNQPGQSTNSNLVVAFTQTCFVNPPSNLHTTRVTNRSIDLVWADNSTNEDGFKVYRWNGVSGLWELKATVGANVTFWEDYPVTALTTYFYEVTSFNASSESNATPWIEVTTDPLPPYSATNLRQTFLSKTAITIAWDDASNNEDGFQIARFNPDWTLDQVVGEVGQNVTSYSIQGLSCGSNYNYGVRAYNISGGYYSLMSVATSNCSAPEPPNNLRQASAKAASITIVWDDMSSDETSFRIYRWNGTTGTWELRAEVGPNVTNFTDTVLNCEWGYFYYVVSYNGVAESSWLNWLEAYTNSCTPAAPSNLRQTASTTNTISLAWTDNSDNEDVFDVWRWGGADWVWVGEVGMDVTAFTDNAYLLCGQTYFYEVSSFANNGSGESLESPWISATTQGCGQDHKIFLLIISR